MWKPGQRLVADRRGLRYPSDLTWAIMIPPGRHGERARADREAEDPGQSHGRVWNLDPQCEVRWPCLTFQSIRSCVSA
jgi:hypothetical protein